MRPPLAPVRAGASPALQINLTYDTNGQVGSIPRGDPQGTQLMALAQAAADYWEDIIEDNHTRPMSLSITKTT